MAITSQSFDWNHAKAFLATAEQGSLSAAARILNLSQPTIGRQIVALEEELGVCLFEREGNQLLITPNGMELVEHVRAMEQAANNLTLSATGHSTSLEGTVCISATEVMATYILPPVIKKLRQLEPGIKIILNASDDVSNLGRREADIALRFFRPTQPDLIVKKIGAMNAQMYASLEFLKAIGSPQKPAQISAEDVIGFKDNERALEELARKGFKLNTADFQIITDNIFSQWELVKLGLGIGFMMFDIGETETSVVQALPDLPPFEGEVWLVTHKELHYSRRIRRVFDLLAQELEQVKHRFCIE